MEIVSENRFSGKIYFYTIGSRMSGEVRLADLRIGDTLTHNLVGVSHRLEAVLDGRDAAAAIEITAALPKEERRTEIINLVSGCFVILTRGQWSYSGFLRG